MSANNITQLCQKAVKSYLDSEDLSFITDEESQIMAGIASTELMLPAVIIQCQRASASVAFEGNWSATLRVELRSNADDTTQDQHHDNAGELFGKFMISQSDARLALSSSTLGFTCQQLLPQDQGWDINDDSWVSFLVLQVDCCGSYFDTA